MTFDQLDWIGLSSSTPDSTWGRVTVDFTGYSTTQYFNLNVDGVWVVQNMGINSLYGSGISQTITTTFDLGVVDGINVSNVSFFMLIGPVPILSIPIGGMTAAVVSDVSYQIGGLGGIDLGSPGAHPPPTGGNSATVTSSAALPNINNFVNQPQGTNECAPGAVSNSLKYLQAAGDPKMDASVPTDISDLRTVLGTDADGTPTNWATTKKNHYEMQANGGIMTTILAANQIAELIAAVNAGKDVEISLIGHAAVIVGVRMYSDGRVELDIADDNQTDNMSDPIRTATIQNGSVSGQGLIEFVVEMAPPPVPSLSQMGFVALCLTMFFAAFALKARRWAH